VNVRAGANRASANKQPADSLLPPVVTARDAWDRAAYQAVSDASMTQATAQMVQSGTQSAPQVPVQNQPDIETAMTHHTDPYLEERFALSDPVMPRESMQPPRRSSPAQQPMHDYGHHQLGDQMNEQYGASEEHYYHHDTTPQQGRHYHDPLGEQAEHYIGHSTPHHRDAQANYGQQGYGQAYHHDQHYEGQQNYHPDHQYHEPYNDYYDDYEAQEPELPSQMFALLVLDPRGSFNRLHIHKTMLGAGLSFSSNGVYVFYDRAGNDSHYIFRVANHNETGFFTDVDDHPEEFSTTGVVLVLEIPNVVTPYRAMNEFIKAARLISQGLGGRLYDANRHVIKESDLKKMRDYAQSITV
jgi:FtsZ-interacting cell division protein ZipA